VAFFGHFHGLVRLVLTVDIPGEAMSYGAGELYDCARAARLDAVPAESVEDAMLQINAWARAHARDASPRILICGSLYLAGAVLTENT
jgi:dihydrofolate synthase/folylpolyglutamate synthase